MYKYREKKRSIRIIIEAITMNIFEQMLSRYDIKTNEQKRNVTHEVMQEVTLAGLYRGGIL